MSDIVIAWDDAVALVAFYTEIGRTDVAAWMRERLEQLRADGYGPGDQVWLGMRPNAEMMN